MKTPDGHKAKVVTCRVCGKKIITRVDKSHSGYCKRCKILGKRNPRYGKPSTNPMAGKGEYKRIIHYRRVKQRLVLLKNNECAMCGAENLPMCCFDFHHLNEKDKTMQLSHLSLYQLKTVEQELKKCIMVCSNCHRAIHHNEIKATDKI